VRLTAIMNLDEKSYSYSRLSHKGETEKEQRVSDSQRHGRSKERSERGTSGNGTGTEELPQGAENIREDIFQN